MSTTHWRLREALVLFGAHPLDRAVEAIEAIVERAAEGEYERGFTAGYAAGSEMLLVKTEE